MKSTFACLLVAICFALVAAQRTYTNRFDNVNVDDVLGNNRILSSYIKCLMERGPCTPEGRELKKLLPDALQTDCEKCTSAQKKNSNKVINYLRANRPGDWYMLLSKYDPSGQYRARHGV